MQLLCRYAAAGSVLIGTRRARRRQQQMGDHWRKIMTMGGIEGEEGGGGSLRHTIRVPTRSFLIDSYKLNPAVQQQCCKVRALRLEVSYTTKVRGRALYDEYRHLNIPLRLLRADGQNA
jgi:hypothetical protein